MLGRRLCKGHGIEVLTGAEEIGGREEELCSEERTLKGKDLVHGQEEVCVVLAAAAIAFSVPGPSQWLQDFPRAQSSSPLSFQCPHRAFLLRKENRP